MVMMEEEKEWKMDGSEEKRKTDGLDNEKRISHNTQNFDFSSHFVTDSE